MSLLIEHCVEALCLLNELEKRKDLNHKRHYKAIDLILYNKLSKSAMYKNDIYKSIELIYKTSGGLERHVKNYISFEEDISIGEIDDIIYEASKKYDAKYLEEYLKENYLL